MGSGDPGVPGVGFAGLCAGIRLWFGWQVMQTQYGVGCCLFVRPAQRVEWCVQELHWGH